MEFKLTEKQKKQLDKQIQDRVYDSLTGIIECDEDCIIEDMVKDALRGLPIKAMIEEYLDNNRDWIVKKIVDNKL